MPNEGSDNTKARVVLTHIDFNMSSGVLSLFMRRLLKTNLGVLKGSLMKYYKRLCTIFNLNIDYMNFVGNSNKITRKFIFNVISLKFCLNSFGLPQKYN